jgi:hypothetical protein
MYEWSRPDLLISISLESLIFPPHVDDLSFQGPGENPGFTASPRLRQFFRGAIPRVQLFDPLIDQLHEFSDMRP